MKQSEKKTKPTYCQNCGGRTGFGFGVEPMRHDSVCCSTKCGKEIFNLERRR